MSRASLKLARSRLKNLLTVADDREFLIMAWGIIALQSGRPEKASFIKDVPREAITEDYSSPYKLHPWKLETLINELLTTPRASFRQGHSGRKLNVTTFNVVASLANTLTAIENEEDGIVLKRVSVLREIHRLTQRQFEWQRGFLSLISLYRSYYIYGGAKSRAYFDCKYPFTMDQFSLGCFALNAVFQSKPLLRRGGGIPELNLTEKVFNAVQDHVSLEANEARKLAAQIRSGGGHTGYKKSILRTFPALRFREEPAGIVCPIPDLIIVRSTSGLFYDLISADDNVKNEISHRFEQYCKKYLTASLPSFQISSSFKYRLKGNEIDTPDLFIRCSGKIEAIIECKATRMSYEARFAEDPVLEAKRGYEEIAKGVFQVWKFVSHVRRGLIVDQEIDRQATGIVLTLDTWLSMAAPIQSDVIGIAKQMAAKRDLEISAEDQIPVCFCPISEIELTLSKASELEFMETLRAMHREDYQGWQISSLHSELFKGDRVQREYPFKDAIHEVLPWWSRFRQT